VNLSLRTLAFRVIGAAIVLNALAGIFVLLGSGSLNETEERIILTVVVLSALSVGLLPAAVSWNRVRIEDLPVLPAISAGSLVLAAGMTLIALWFRIDNESGGQSIFTMAIFGIATAHACLLTLARESELRWIATALTALLAAIFFAAIWAEDAPDWRLTGIVIILWFATSLLVPVRQWAMGRPATVRAAADYESIRYCPYCGERVHPTEDVITCRSCEATFQVSNVVPVHAAERSRQAVD